MTSNFGKRNPGSSLAQSADIKAGTLFRWRQVALAADGTKFIPRRYTIDEHTVDLAATA